MPDFSQLTLNDISKLLINKKSENRKNDSSQPESNQKSNLLSLMGKLKTDESIGVSNSKSAFSKSVTKHNDDVSFKDKEPSPKESPSSNNSSQKDGKN